MNIEKLWHEGTEEDWNNALNAYYKSPTVNMDLENRMDDISPEFIRKMSIQEFYNFLYYEFFVWKYTANNRLETTRAQLEKHKIDCYSDLERIRTDIFKAYNNDPEDTDSLLYKTQQIRGLGTAGASGLLAVLFPEYYGTLDQYLCCALCRIEDLPELSMLEAMQPEGLTIKDGVLLEAILRRKAKELNMKFNTDKWTPRKIDMVLWASDRKQYKLVN